MISDKKEDFDLPMKNIVDFIDLKNYSNNSSEHVSNLNSFFKSYFSKMSFKTINTNDISGEYSFSMMYQGKVAFGYLVYIPGKLGSLGSYNLTIDM